MPQPDTKPSSTIVKNPNKQALNDANIKSKWWLERKELIYKSVFAVVDKLNSSQNTRIMNCLKYARLYQNVDLLTTGLNGLNSVASNANLNQSGTRVTYNVVKSCCDTLGAKVSKNKPKVQFLTEEGDFTLENKAKNLTRYIQGSFDMIEAYDKCQRMFTDAEVLGTGCGYVYPTPDGNIEFERVFALELTVDELDAIYGKPSSLHRTRLVTRDVMKDKFPKFAREIDEATAGTKIPGNNIDSDQIRMIESWHLKSGSDAKDGIYTISIDSATLYTEEYKKTRFPFVFFHWSNRLVGFWGQSLAEELAGIQIEINKLLRCISVAQDRMCIPTILVENGSKISTDALTFNQIARIINYSSTPPQFVIPAGMAPEMYAYVETLKKSAYEVSGISQLSATGKKQEGLDSGIAIREVNDIESERFVLAGQRYERLFLDLADLIIDISRDVYEEKKKLSIKVKGGKFIETIDWGDVDMDADVYSMQAFPISMLPSTPAGKLATIQNLIQAGFIPHEYGFSLLDFPDLEEFTSLSTAALETTRMIIERMLTKGIYTAPDPYLDLNLAMNLTHTTYLRSLHKKGIKPENLDLLRVFMQDIQNLLAEANPPAPQMPAVQGAPANPVAAPVSNLIPQAAPQQ